MTPTALHPNNLTAWAHLQDLRTMPRPLPEPLDPATLRTWIHAIYVRSSRDKTIREAIEKTVAATVGTKRRWCAIDGVADIGKTETILNYALQTMWGNKKSTPPTRVDGYLQLPILFAEADPSQQGAGILAEICRFAGISSVGGETGMRNRLHDLLPHMGTRIIIVDDINMHHRESATATRLTDSWRANLRLPVTFVCVGAGVERSALLNTGMGGPLYHAAEQLHSRHHRADLKPLVLPKHDAELKYLVTSFTSQVRAGLPRFTFTVLGSSGKRTMDDLAEACDYKHGKILGTLKDATIRAYEDGSNDLKATHVAASLLRHTTETHTSPRPAPNAGRGAPDPRPKRAREARQGQPA